MGRIPQDRLHCVMSGQANTPSHPGDMPRQTGLGLPPWISRGSVLMVLLAVLAPAVIPVMIVGLPALGVITVWRLKKQEEAAEAPKLVEIEERKEKVDDEKKNEEKPLPVKKDESADPKPVTVKPDATADSGTAKTAPPSSGTAKTAPPSSASAGKPAAVGGAAILARLRAAKQMKTEDVHPIVVTYASQTGTAAEVAKNIGSSISNEGLKSRVLPMNELGLVSSLSKEKTPFIIWVASSTGDGEAPDNATKFYNDLRNKNRNEPGALRGIQFTGLGLGDSNYTRFMHVPRVVKNRFLELGATEFHPCVEADEVDGIEEIIDAWVEKLLPAVKAAMKPGDDADRKPVFEASKAMALPACSVEVLFIKEEEVDVHREQATSDSGEISAASPFLATISEARYLTTEVSDADRRVIHVQFDLKGSGIEYGPGDSLGVLPENDPSLVDALLKRINVDGSKLFALVHKGQGDTPGSTRPLQHIKWPCSVRDAFLHGVDLTGPPKKSLLRVMAEYCTQKDEQARLMRMCSREGRQEYMESIIKGRRAFVDVLFENPSCKPPLGALLDALPPLAPRMYSISSSPLSKIGPDKAEVAFTAVEYPTASGDVRKGVATWWLESKALRDTAETNQTVPLYLRKGGVFSPPASLHVPWIMIGPGTGVSPFRGFLQQRRAAVATGPAGDMSECWLFFGCRDKAKDYLYGDELEGFVEDGTLTKLCVAESRRDPNNKVYVQHLMRQHKDRLRDLIVDHGAFVFICGDGHGMAKDVHTALVEIISSGGDMDAKEADTKLASMTREGRYVKDVWS